MPCTNTSCCKERAQTDTQYTAHQFYLILQYQCISFSSPTSPRRFIAAQRWWLTAERLDEEALIYSCCSDSTITEAGRGHESLPFPAGCSGGEDDDDDDDDAWVG